MRAAVLYNDREIRATGGIPEPKPSADQVLVQSGYAGICGTDVHVYRGEFKSRVRYPAILGHEFAGTIVDAGKAVENFGKGDRVVVDPIMSCHRCPACLLGQINACTSLRLLGIDLEGGFGELVAVPQDRLYRLPDDIPMEWAPMVELYAVGHHILRRGRVQPGETVAILGAGRLGLSILDVLSHSARPARVIAVDFQEPRLKLASKIGAEAVIDARLEDPVEKVKKLTQGRGVDCVIEAIGHFHELEGRQAPLAQAVEMIRNGGRIVTAGLGEQLSAVHFKTLVIKEAEIIASRVTLGEFPWAIRLLSLGVLHPELLITSTVPIREVDQAFASVNSENPEVVKVVLDVGQW